MAVIRVVEPHADVSEGASVATSLRQIGQESLTVLQAGRRNGQGSLGELAGASVPTSSGESVATRGDLEPPARLARTARPAGPPPRLLRSRPTALATSRGSGYPDPVVTSGVDGLDAADDLKERQ